MLLLLLPRRCYPTLCRCNTAQGILPFTVSPRYYPLPNIDKTTIEYCFIVNVIPKEEVLPVGAACHGCGGVRGRTGGPYLLVHCCEPRARLSSIGLVHRPYLLPVRLRAPERIALWPGVLKAESTSDTGCVNRWKLAAKPCISNCVSFPPSVHQSTCGVANDKLTKIEWYASEYGTVVAAIKEMQ